MKKTIFFTLVLSLFAFGCGDDHDHEENNHNHENNEEFNPEEEGCEHMAEGPFADAATGESIAVEHTRVNVALTETATMEFEATVNFDAKETTEYLFFLSDDVSFAVTDANGTEVPVEASAASTICPDDIATILTYDLEVGTYEITLSSPDVETVGVVHEEAGGHSEEDHNHDE